MKNFDHLLDGFMAECRARGIGDETVSARRIELLRFGNFLKSKRPKVKLDSIDVELITVYLKNRATFRSKATVASTMSHLRCFGDFLNREAVWKRNHLRWLPSPKIPVNSHLPKSLTKSQIESILSSSLKHKEILYQYLWPAVVLCMYSLGMRRGEVARLNLEDWDPKARTLKVSNTKSGFERYVPVPDCLETAIESYLQVRQRTLTRKKALNEPALFINNTGSRLSPGNISGGTKRIAKRAGVEDFSTHRFRHSCATHLLDNGVGLKEVKLLLGHACIDTSNRYTHVSGPLRKQAMNLHPINKMLEAAQ
jgi:site-specific recombinase XerD